MLDSRLCKLVSRYYAKLGRKVLYFNLPGEDVLICCSCTVFWTEIKKKTFERVILIN